MQISFREWEDSACSRRAGGPVKLEPTAVGCYEVKEGLHGVATLPVNAPPMQISFREWEDSACSRRAGSPVKLEPTAVGCYEVKERLHEYPVVGPLHPCKGNAEKLKPNPCPHGQ